MWMGVWPAAGCHQDLLIFDRDFTPRPSGYHAKGLFRLFDPLDGGMQPTLRHVPPTRSFSTSSSAAAEYRLDDSDMEMAPRVSYVSLVS